MTRIVVMGDSYTFGWGVSEERAFPQRCERLLELRHPSRHFEIVDAGIPGFSLYQQEVMLDRLLGALRVDAVISTFTICNDMADEARIRRCAPDRLLDYSPWPRDPATILQFEAANTSRRSLSDAQESLEAIATMCRERSIPLLLLLVPRRA